jgi:hypothetical protein
VGQIADMLAEPALYSYEGKEYRVHPWTYEVQAKFERYLEKYALDAYHRQAPYLSSEDAEKALSGVMRDIAAGCFTFGSETVGKALSTPVHVKYLWFLCVKKHHPEVTLDQAGEMCRRDYGGVIRAMNMANAVRPEKGPNAEGGEAAAPPAAPATAP